MRILSLCDFTGNILKPWAQAGHECIAVDIAYDHDHVDELGIKRIKADVLNFKPAGKFDVIFAFPPCTHLAVSGARWWAKKGPAALLEARLLVFACAAICQKYTKPDGWWLLENPVGRLPAHWRKADYTFNPCDYGDPYTKRTCLWAGGSFIMPPKTPVEPTEGSKMHKIHKGKDQARLRSVTPVGFSEAVYKANSVPLKKA